MRRLLVFGLGYSASRFVLRAGAGFGHVAGTARTPEAAAERAAALGVETLAFDGLSAGPALRGAVAAATHILVSIPPDATGDPVLRALADDIAAAPALAWIGYLSTVGVYGGFDGAWIDEDTPIRPTAERNRRRAEVERAWIDLGARAGRAVQVFRLAGIYGPGQNAVRNLREGTARRIVKPGQVFNRIHVDDIAGALIAGIGRPAVGPLINVADDEPAPPQDVIAYAAHLLGREPPPEIDFEAADLSPMGRSFYGENKRVSNRRLRRELGCDLLYPTYREGIRACLDED
ncbi:SDR family oxidoreductase [Labrys wisconsinensis]|uniref:Nucleoside-diphosphate-sugar epimerase n=1 Tax=Labrys wisconsinensis TaxID=425677 RepID=A0ABU0JGM6_9HYPH|nr:SDR family oxidoreductase [Labrys wisconsinensis]MDQ0472394.1 nucleoside-diphosphate-sugar epimerase [Labrys wisconsinensis]